MGTITSGVGLISGLDYQDLISKLIAIEARPRDMLQQRASNIDAQRTAFMDISARLSGLLSKVVSLKQSSVFNANKVSSSNSSLIGASATSATAPGSYRFIVKSLAATHQLVSRGFTNRDTQLQAGELLIESARARVNADTNLDVLNGYSGVARGSFDLVDGTGRSARIDISSAVTLTDVVERINASGLDVTAAVSGDQLILTETNGRSLRVREVNGGSTAAGLGFGPGNTYAAGGALTGTSLMYLTNDTPLSALNDGNGVSFSQALGDFQVNNFTVKLSEILDADTNLHVLNRGRGVELGVVRVTVQDDSGAEQQYQVDLRGMRTAGEVKNALEGGVEGITVTLVNNRLRVAYSSGGDSKTLKIEDVGGHAARDLGIDQSSASGRIDGKSILHMDTVGAVLAAINYADGNDGSVTASINGARLALAGTGQLQLGALNNSNALNDLGFTAGAYDGSVNGRRVVSGLNGALLSSLNGGRGFEAGRIRIQAGAEELTLDLTGLETLQEVLDRINEAARVEGLNIEAGYDQSGTRLVIESLDGSSLVAVSDVEGTFATDLGLSQSQPATRLRSNNLQKQYVSGAQRLDSLNNGRGTTVGVIQIKNSRGLLATVDLTGNSNIRTLQDVIDRINEATLPGGSALGVTARINDKGDGVIIEDAAGGELALEITDLSGTVARDMGIAGTSSTGIIDGSREISVQIAQGDTLDDVLRKINARGGLVSASILNDGTSVAPYRLQLTSAQMGLAGELLVDGLGFTTMTSARDARVLLGDNPSSGVLITSSTNTITDIVPGLTLDLTAASDEVVTVNVKRDLDSVVSAFSAIIESYNSTLTRIKELSKYDSENQVSGILLGDGTLLSIDKRLSQLILTNRDSAVGNLRRLADFGIRFREGKLELDEQKLRSILNERLDDAIEFFTDGEKGFAATLQSKLEYITKSGGLIDRHDDALEQKKRQITERIETLNQRLDRKSEQLLKQFLAMESALAQMQSQQNVLTQLATLAGSKTGSS